MLVCGHVSSTFLTLYSFPAAEISNFRFSDTSHTSKGLNSKSPPKKILYAHTPHVAMYGGYLGHPFACPNTPKDVSLTM